MADHGEGRRAFARLLCEANHKRVLLVRGASETGKSHMSRQMIRNAMLLPGVVSGRFDFKGTTNIGVEIEAFSGPLGLEPPGGQTLNERLAKIFTELRRRARPSLLIFDTYEAAGETKDWIEGVLLPHLVSARWLRVVIIGQSVPSRAGAIWESVADGPLTLQLPGPEDWLAYGRTNRGETLDLEFVTLAHQYADGKPSLLAGLLGPSPKYMDGAAALDSVEQLRLIRDAHGDPALLALATVDLTFPDIPNADREALRMALEVAAVPHWCDASILAELIGSSSLIADQWARLKAVPVIEPFPARGADARNVHEASRLAIRKHLAETQQKWFTELSGRSVRLFKADTRPIGQIEWIYHLLVVNPEQGAAELEDLDRTWSDTARNEDLAALSGTLTELETSQILEGKALLRVRLVIAQHRATLAGAASLGNLANQLLEAAQAIDDARLTADAYCLVGDVAQARGDLAAAGRSFAQYLAICERLAALDPANTGWQRDLAVAHSRVGDVAQARGDLAAAERSFAQALAISERLAVLDPANTGWQQGLAAAHSRVGDAAQARGDLAAAGRSFAQALAISRAAGRAGPGQHRLAAGPGGRAQPGR